MSALAHNDTPEMMSPADYLTSRLAIANRVARLRDCIEGLRRQAATGNLLAARDLVTAEAPDSYVNQIIARLEAGEVTDDIRFDMSQDYRSYVRAAFLAHRPVHAEAVDLYGEPLPVGYAKDGGLYRYAAA